VPTVQVSARAWELGATPFDIGDCELGHHREGVFFNSILKKYNLTDPALAVSRCQLSPSCNISAHCS